MYARGMTVREIQGHLLELYGLEVSPDLIAFRRSPTRFWRRWPNGCRTGLAGTDVSAGFLRRAAGQNPRRGLVRNKATSMLPLGVTPEGTKDILERFWIETSEER